MSHDALIALRPAGPADARLLWECRNDPAARAASLSSAIIPWEQHERWYAARLHDAAARLHVVTGPAGEPLGYVRFSLAGDTAEISIGLAAAARGLGAGRRAIAAGCAALFAEPPATRPARILARVKPGNEASLRAFRAAGFTDAGSGDGGAGRVHLLQLAAPAGDARP